MRLLTSFVFSLSSLLLLVGFSAGDHADSPCDFDHIAIRLDGDLLPPNREEALQRLRELRQNRSDDRRTAHLQEVEERKLEDSLSKFLLSG